MNPTYQKEKVTLYLGDSKNILPKIDLGVVITDPPYGVGLGIQKDIRKKGHGLGKKAYKDYEDTYEEWCQNILPILKYITENTKRAAIFSGPHIQEQQKATAIGGIFCPAGCGRHQWGFKTFLPVLFYGTAPRLNEGAQPNTIQSTATAQYNGHPCPKPLEWMDWLVDIASEPEDTIVDPFNGSGTTGEAAIRAGRKYIGIEKEEKYMDITVARLDALLSGRKPRCIAPPPLVGGFFGVQP